MPFKLLAPVAALFAFAAGPALPDGHAPVQGDAAAGESVFRQCIACHVVTDPDGNTLAGRSSKIGPNLYGVAGAAAGSVAGFRYTKPLLAAGAGGLIWTEESFAAFVQDPTAYLREVTGDSKARSRMTFKLRDAGDAADLYAYLFSLANPQ